MIAIIQNKKKERRGSTDTKSTKKKLLTPFSVLMSFLFSSLFFLSSFFLYSFQFSISCLRSTTTKKKNL